MKTLKIILSITVYLLTGYCHAQFVDNFSDGDFTINPAWTGDNSKFIINTGKLKLQAQAASESAFLSVPSQAIHKSSWEFYLQMDFTPSSTNQVKIYLVADHSNLNGTLNGYFIKAGNTAREISLYRQSGTTETEIIDGLDDRINLPLVKIKIRVTRSESGLWQLFSDVGPSGTYSSEGTFTDNTFTNASYFGIQCIYTSTRSDKFWFDDFIVTGTTVPDTTPPVVQSVTTNNAQQVSLLFSEPVESSSSQNSSNFSLENIGAPASIDLSQDQKTLTLNFLKSFVNGVTYPLHVSNVKDLAGNVIKPSIINCLFFQPVPVHNKDIIFTELFPDPSPQIGLPNAEFVEIYNRSNDPFNIGGWKITDGSSTGIFPSQIILPGEYWIITAISSVNLFTSLGKTIGLSNFPTLNNDGDTFVIRNPNNLTIDSVSYNLNWYRDVDKQQGGWTLELIDPKNPCGEQDNWIASEDPKGGSPGRQNAVFADKPDLSPPVLMTVFPESSTKLLLTFNEKLDRGSLALENFDLQPAVANSKSFFTDTSLRTIGLEVKDISSRKMYTLAVKNVRDCSNNEIQLSSFSFGLPEKADSLDIVVNEILFNPRSGGVDFVEVVNTSPKFLNLKNWKLGNYKNSTPSNIITLFNGNTLLSPNGFAVFTSDPLIVEAQYTNSVEPNLYKTPLPGLSDDEGSVLVLNDAGKILDEVFYSKEWHSTFIKSDEGVSLERIDPKSPSNNPVNWTSASSSMGFATPGFANSQQRPEKEIDEEDVLIVPEIFTPGTGLNDFVQIQYRFDQGSVANVKVYDVQGHLLRTLANNETLGTEGFLKWEGERDDGTKARMGYYIVWFEIFNSAGLVKTYRKRVIVSSR